ncbi:MAG: HAMP domain-containing sensor histidine kinase, partial [Cyanobacteria bacterium J06642_11]
SPHIQAQLDDIDLDFIFHDIPSILNSMKAGTTRLTTIIKELRNFAHLDQATEKIIDIHQALDHTLLVVNHRLQPSASRIGINLHKDYRFNLNMIRCYPQLLNQSLFHLLTNAIDAIDEKADAVQSIPPPEIKITTEQQKSSLLITISDNGIGITPEDYPHIFDPFFTTKPAGQGIGLGLSTAHQTVERHQGSLHCQSVPHQGTTFEIWLPLK